ncbi:MAG: hemolysin III family protein [Bacteroidetes bacterium]|nr:hemolysin III family protein [Bacteroidota bacterium]
MKHVKDPTYYPPIEEKINVLTHALGLLLSVFALVLLVIKSSISGTSWHIVSFSIFGASLIILYAASTFFHNSKKIKVRKRLNIFDHASIYILIAGTYTPFTLVTLNGTIGWILFGITWGIALTGVILKLFFTGKYDKISTIAYVLMGWIIVFAFKPLLNNFSSEGIVWLVFGGVAYTIGAVLYSLNRLNFNHAIFHIFVLLGSFCHFISIYFYV